MFSFCLERAILNWAIANLSDELLALAREEHEYLRDWAGMRYIARVGDEIDPIHEAGKQLLLEGKRDAADQAFRQSREQHNAIAEQLMRAQEIVEWLRWDAIARYDNPDRRSTWPDLRHQAAIESEQRRKV